MNRIWRTLAVLSVLMVGFMWGDEAGFRAGERRAEERQVAAKADHDAVMRKIGVCSWAKVMATLIECKTEFKPGEP